MASPLRQLACLLTSSVDTIEREFASKGLTFPNIDKLYNFDSIEESVARSPTVVAACRVAIAAAAQLTAMIHSPSLYAIEHGIMSYFAAALNVVVTTGIVELLRESGPQGLHVDLIAEKTDLDGEKLARILRLLASKHIFTERTPDVFVNNRLSSAMDTGKSFAEFRSNPLDRHEGTSGLAALLEVQTGEGLKACGWTADFLTDPLTAGSNSITNIPFNRGHRTELTIWQWWETPGHEYLKKRFNKAMEAFTSQERPESILQGFPWAELPPDSKIVDVAGGLGTVSAVIADAHPDLQFVVEDRYSVIQHAKKFWQKQVPKAKVTFEVFDLFNEQPVKDADVFIMRLIIHDWPEWYSVAMLRQLRAVSKPSTRLVVMEHVLDFACEDTTPARDIPGAQTEETRAPAPLLPNFGAASQFSYLSDLLMMGLLNGKERTLISFAQLLNKAGWSIERVNVVPGSVFKQIVAMPF